MEKSIKNDRTDGKLRWELLPLEDIEGIVEVFTFGAQKYAPNTWQNLDNGFDRYFAACMRHMTAYRKGETNDPESGLSHMKHAAWNMLACLHYANQQEKQKDNFQE